MSSDAWKGVLSLAVLGGAVYLVVRYGKRSSPKMIQASPASKPTLSPAKKASRAFSDAYFQYAQDPSDYNRDAAKEAYEDALDLGVSSGKLEDAAAEAVYEVGYKDDSGDYLNLNGSQMFKLASFGR